MKWYVKSGDIEEMVVAKTAAEAAILGIMKHAMRKHENESRADTYVFVDERGFRNFKTAKYKYDTCNVLKKAGYHL